jgi:hypothetical protein
LLKIDKVPCLIHNDMPVGKKSKKRKPKKKKKITSVDGEKMN